MFDDLQAPAQQTARVLYSSTDAELRAHLDGYFEDGIKFYTDYIYDGMGA
jgi:hypothetical protein